MNEPRDKRTLRKGARRGSAAQTFQAPPSPAKSDVSTGGGVKRKGRPQDIDLPKTDERSCKRSRPGSQVPTPNSENPPSPQPGPTGMLECPEPNCKKKYRHLNGLRYHQSHAHPGFSGNSSSVDETKDSMDTEDIPLSVVKNNAKKEKENKKDVSNVKKDGKDSDKSKSDKDEKNLECDEELDENILNTNVDKSKGDNAMKETSAKKKDLNAITNTSESIPRTIASKPGANVNTSQINASVTNSLETPSQISVTSSMPSSVSNSVASVNNIPVTAVSEQGRTDKNMDNKTKPGSEIRTTKPNRPIVPAVSNQMIASVQVTHSNLNPVMTHAQVSPQLKPIQPKPTVMGEAQNVNPALADLGKDKKKVPKKKSKDVANTNNASGKVEQSKVERMGVIKTNPLPNNKPGDPNRKDVPGPKEVFKNLTEHQRMHNLGANQNRSVDLTRENMKGANLLKVGSPLQVNTTPDNRKTPVNDDVQSPAYSDISDANESASPAANNEVSPQKHKDQVQSKKEDKQDSNPAQQPPDMPHYGGMYYYGQSPYMNNMSPSQIPPGAQNKPMGNQNPMNPSPGNKDPKQQGEDKKTGDEANKGDKSKPDEAKDSNKPKVNVPGSGPPPSNMSPQQMQEYQMQQQQQHQNWLKTQMYIQSLPPHLQYQYQLANGWYFDPAYMKQMMDEQRRMQMEAGGGKDDREKEGPEGQVPGAGQRPGEGKGPWDGRPEMKGNNPGNPQKLDESAAGVRPSVSQTVTGDKGDLGESGGDKTLMKEQALREKQNENHQILKENIDLKNEMDKNIILERQRQEEKRRLQMYKEQKERKKMELARKEARPDNPPSIKAPGTKPIIEHGPRPQHVHSDIMRDNSAKRDSSVDSKMKEQRDSGSRDNSLNRPSDMSNRPSDMPKTIGGDKSRTPGPPGPDKPRPIETPKTRPGGSSSKSGSPSSSVHSSGSVPGSPSYSPYVSYASSYIPGHQYGPIAMDPNHPMYRNVNPALIGSYPGNPYIHPSQLGYRVGPDEEKDKSVALSRASPSDMDPKKTDVNRAQYYGNVHKIHELSEKGRPRSHSGSPGPQKPPPDTSSSPYDKHRDRDYTKSPPPQRHVHTHHHTHVLQPGIQTAPIPVPVPQQQGFSPVYASK